MSNFLSWWKFDTMIRYLKNPHCMVCFKKMKEIKLQLPNSRLPMCSDECYEVILPKKEKK